MATKMILSIKEELTEGSTYKGMLLDILTDCTLETTDRGLAVHATIFGECTKLLLQDAVIDDGSILEVCAGPDVIQILTVSFCN
jgi:hypothetical protein